MGRAIGGYVRVVDLQIAVGKSRVTQTISKPVEGLAIEIAVGPFRHRVIFECRDLVNRLVERYRQPSTGTDISGERFGNRSSSFSSGVPGFQNCGKMLIGPIYGDRASIG